MRWTKARARVEELFAPSVAKHVGLRAARYRGAHDAEGRGWITWDGEEIASFETIPYLIRRNASASERQRSGTGVEDSWDAAGRDANRAGSFALWEFTEAVEGYPELSVDVALASSNPITRALAMLDRRLGKRRLATMSLASDEQPFVRRLYALRCEAEGIEIG